MGDEDHIRKQLAEKIEKQTAAESVFPKIKKNAPNMEKLLPDAASNKKDK
jgi:hypothetical protein